MKIRIELEEDLLEEEIIIRCSAIDDKVQRIYQILLEEEKTKIVFYKGEQEFYFPLSQILFFETSNDNVYAHTKNDSYRIKYRLYELEEMLPIYFLRISKSTIVDTRKIYSITRNVTSVDLIEFQGTHKQIYVSRHYSKLLREKMKEGGSL